MKHLLGAASAVAMLLASGSSFAQGQYQAPAAVPGAAQVPGAMAPAAPSMSMQGDAAADVDVATIVAALGDARGEIGKLSSLPVDAKIQIVDLDTYMLQGDAAATLTPALTAAEGQGDALRKALEANSVVQAQLVAQDISIESVVGFGIDGSTILVFTQGSVEGAGAPAPSANGDAAIGAPPMSPVAP